jgi:hypothetical protein
MLNCLILLLDFYPNPRCACPDPDTISLAGFTPHCAPVKKAALLFQPPH